MAQKPVLVSFLLLVFVVTLGSSWRDAMTMCQEVHVEPRNEMHLVYAIEASSANEYQQQLDLLTQSAWSAFSVGCDALRCRRRLHAHVFYWRIPKHALEDSLAPLIFRGFRISTHETDFDSAVTRQRKVWGYRGHEKSLQQKLMHAANYYRFYAPSLLRQCYNAKLFLYLDTDVLFMRSGLDGLFSSTTPIPIVSAGVQRLQNCRMDRMLLLNDPRLAGLGLRPDDPCLTASVMLVNISAWIAANTTQRVEMYLAQNAVKKLWHLGSMPPLMIVLAGKWAQLPGIADGKGSNCESVGRYRGSLLVHPFKERCLFLPVPPRPRLCSALGPGSSLTGSSRIAHMHSTALARLLGVELLHGHDMCDVVLALGHVPRTTNPKSVRIVFKPSNTEATTLDEADRYAIMVSDNGFMDAMWRAKGQASIRLQLVEDVRPVGVMHKVRPIAFGPGEARVPLLCYHGNHMHIQSLLPVLGDIRSPFKLLVLVEPRATKALAKQVDALEWRAGMVDFVAYDPRKIYQHLAECDLGLAPSEVAPTGDVGQVARQTAPSFVQVDEQPEDMVKRCKRTSNAGRAFVFMQLGVPAIVDACPESVLFSSFNEKPTVLVSYRHDAWSQLIADVLADPWLRRELSSNSHAFAVRHLTTRAQATKLLHRVGCTSLIANHSNLLLRSSSI